MAQSGANMTVAFWVESGALAAMSLFGQVVPGGGDFVQYGALGLAAFMVWQNYRQADKLGKIIDSQRAELQTANKRLEELHVETLQTIRKCTAAGVPLKSTPNVVLEK
jgi:hypothetical protein